MVKGTSRGRKKGEREGPSRGGNGEIWCVRDTSRERGRERKRGSFVRLSDSGCIDRATCMCYIPPSYPARTERDRTPPADLSPRIDPPASTGSARVPPSSHYPPPPLSPCLILLLPAYTSSPPPLLLPTGLANGGNQPSPPPAAGLYVMSKCCEIIARKSDWQQTRNSSTRDARAARGGMGIWVRGLRGRVGRLKLRRMIQRGDGARGGIGV